MKRRPFGRTGVRVTEICLGTMTFGKQCDEAQSFAIMDKAWEAGVDFLTQQMSTPWAAVATWPAPQKPSSANG